MAFAGIFTTKTSIGGWTSLGPPGGNILAITLDPKNGSVAYAGTSDGIFKTSDGGDTWRSINTGLPHRYVTSIAVDPANGSRVFAGTSLGVARSTDAGETWTPSAAGMNVRHARWWGVRVDSLAIDCRHPQTIYAGVGWPGNTGGGIFKTTDSGGSWRLLPGIPDAPAARVVIDARRTSTVYAALVGCGIYKSTDGGAAWRKLPVEAEAVRCLAMDPSNPSHIVAGTWNSAYSSAPERGILRSTDAGESWVLYGSSISFFDLGFVSTKREEGAIFAISDEDVLRSPDAGRQWDRLLGFPEHAGVSALAAGKEAARIIAGTRGRGLFRSEDGGVTWHALTSGLPRASVSGAAVDGRDRKHMICSDGWIVFTTQDGGENWDLRSHLPDINCDEIDFRLEPGFADSIFVSRCAAARSSDGGLSWTALRSDGETLRQARWGPPGTHVAFGVSSAHVFVSNDRGLSWKRLPTPFERLRGLETSATDSAKLWVWSDRAFYVSSDSGQSWTKYEFPQYCGLPIAVDRKNGAAYGIDRNPEPSETQEGDPPWISLLSGHIHALAIDPADGWLYYALSNNIHPEFSSIFAESPDGQSGGEVTGALKANVNSVVADPHGGAIYVCTDRGIFAGKRDSLGPPPSEDEADATP
jgi:photosystem II stability/assembly factor-like uncharacterized protein